MELTQRGGSQQSASFYRTIFSEDFKFSELANEGYHYTTHQLTKPSAFLMRCLIRQLVLRSVTSRSFLVTTHCVRRCFPTSFCSEQELKNLQQPKEKKKNKIRIKAALDLVGLFFSSSRFSLGTMSPVWCRYEWLCRFL